MRIILYTINLPQISAGLNRFEQGQQKKKGEDVEIWETPGVHKKKVKAI